jgi:chromate transporter
MMRDEFRYPAMFLVVVLTMIAATVFHLGLGYVVLLVTPIAIFLARKKAQAL